MRCQKDFMYWRCTNEAFDEGLRGMCAEHTYLEEELDKAIKTHRDENIRIAEAQIEVRKAELVKLSAATEG